MAVHPNASIVEMDTVEGIKGGKVFLTLLFRNYNFMLIFLMESKSMEEVEKIFIKIRNLIGIDTFKRIFEVILTDNGSEFLIQLVLKWTTIQLKFYLMSFIAILIVLIKKVLLKKTMNI